MEKEEEEFRLDFTGMEMMENENERHSDNTKKNSQEPKKNVVKVNSSCSDDENLAHLMISNKVVFNDLCGQRKTQPKEINAYDELYRQSIETSVESVLIKYSNS